MPKRIIKTDVTDWDDDFATKEPDVMSDEEIIKQRKSGMHPAEVGRHIVIARERGLAPKDVIRPVKALINLAASAEVSKIVAKKMEVVNLANGNKAKIRSLVAPVSDGEDEEVDEIDVAVVESVSENGLENAVNYLLRIIPGHIYSRLAIIASNGEDVEKYAEELKGIIDEIVVKLG